MYRLRSTALLVTLPALLLGLFVAGPLAAQANRLTPGLAGERPPAPAAPEVASSLFWPLPQGLFFLSGTISVEVEVLLDGQLSFSESFRMEMPESLEGRAVELLTTRPRELSRLREIAVRDLAAITVRILVDGVEWDARPFAELDAVSRQLQQGRLQLARLTFGDPSEPEVPLRQTSAAATACEDQCDQEWWDCIETECYPEIICETCEVEHELCLDNCNPPPPPTCQDPKSVTYRTVTTLVGFGPTGYWQCYEDIFESDFYDGEWYEEWQYTYKDTRYKRTEYCNGTVTEEVVQVTYWYYFCNRPTFLFCYYPFTWAYNVCY